MNLKRRNNCTRSRFSILFPILTIVGIGIIAALSSFYQQSWTFNWNGIRADIKDSIKVAKIRSTQSKQIIKNATEYELLKLTDYPNGIVKGIAYEGLLRKKGFSNKTELILKAIRDTTYQIDYQSGCLGWNMSIGEYLVQNVLLIDDEIPPPERPPDFGLTETEKEKILAEFRMLQVK